MKKSIIFSVLTAMLVFAVLFVVICPTTTMTKLEPDGKAVLTVQPKDGIQLTEGAFLQDGTISLPNPSIKDHIVLEFKGTEEKLKFAQINFAAAHNNNIRLVVEKTADGSFTDLPHIETELKKGESSAIIKLQEGKCKAIRIWFFADCKLKNVSFYNTELVEKNITVRPSSSRSLFTVVMTIITFIVMLNIDKRSNISEKFFGSINSLYQKTKKNIPLSLLAAILVFLLLFSVLCPAATQLKKEPSTAADFTVSAGQAVQLTEGEYLPDGTIKLPTPDIKDHIVLEFKTEDKAFKNMQMTFASAYQNDGRLVVERSRDGSFTDLTPIEAILKKGENTAWIKIGQNNYQAIRIWFFADCKLEKLDFYNGDLIEKTVKVNPPASRYFLVAVLSIAAFVIMIILDKKYLLTDKILDRVSSSYKNLKNQKKPSKNKAKKDIIFSLIAAFLVGITAFAVICPSITVSRLSPSSDPVVTVLPESAVQLTAGSFSPDGTIDVDKTPLVLEFKANDETAKLVQIDYETLSTKDVKLIVERSSDGSFKDLSHFEAGIVAGEKRACFKMEENKYYAIRVWFHEDCKIKGVSFYNTDPIETKAKLKLEAWRYLLVLAITLFSFALILIINKKTDCFNKIGNYFKNNYKQILKVIATLVGIAVLSVILEILYRMLFGAGINDFNKSSCAAVFALLAIISVFVINRKNLAAASEKAVGLIILILGLSIVVAQPFSHVCWDNDSHYPWALQNSFFKTAYYTESDICVDVPLETFRYSPQGYSDTVIEKLNAGGKHYVKENSVTFSLSHVPSGLFIALSRLFGADFYTRYMFGQSANIICYAIICYFAIKKLKSGKMIASVIALLPTNIFMASNYTYDWWVIGFALLGTAYYVSELQQPEKPMNIRDTVIMCAAFMLMSVPKQIYVVLFALPLFMFKNYKSKKEKINYYKILLLFMAFTAMLFIIRATTIMGGTGDLRGGAVNPSEQLAGILKNPIRYAIVLIKFLLKYLSITNMPGYIDSFAYLGWTNLSAVFIVLICFTALTDKDKGDKFKNSVIVRIIAALLLIGGSALVATSMYIAFTPVGLDTINGCQERYITPFLPAVLLTIANPGIVFKNKAVYNTAVLSITTAAAWVSIADVVMNII